MADAARLTTLADVKNLLQIASTVQTWDAQIEGLVTAASRMIEAHCHRNFKSQTFTDYFNGIGQTTLCLRNYPVASVTSVNSDSGRDFTSATVVSSDDYYLEGDTGTIYFDFPLSRGQRNLKVVYVGGYTAYPADLVAACNRLVSILFNERKSAGYANESLGNFSKGFKPWGDRLPMDVEAMLTQYVRYAETE